MEKVYFEEKMKQLRHTIECKNIANLMCLLCMERRKCLSEKTEIENYYKSQIALMGKHLGSKNDKIKQLSQQLKDSQKETSLREKCILEIIKQYQKFINFVLKSAPTQAEFLLSIEKMMVFELTDSILKSDMKFVPHCDNTLKWKAPSKEIKKKVPSMELKDGHNCTNIVHKASPDDVLASFIYKDKLYVREEFRDIVSNLNNEISNNLWLDNDENVQMLISLMRKSVDSHTIAEQVPKR